MCVHVHVAYVHDCLAQELARVITTAENVDSVDTLEEFLGL